MKIVKGHQFKSILHSLEAYLFIFDYRKENNVSKKGVFMLHNFKIRFLERQSLKNFRTLTY